MEGSISINLIFNAANIESMLISYAFTMHMAGNLLLLIVVESLIYFSLKY